MVTVSWWDNSWLLRYKNSWEHFGVPLCHFDICKPLFMRSKSVSASPVSLQYLRATNHGTSESDTWALSYVVATWFCWYRKDVRAGGDVMSPTTYLERWISRNHTAWTGCAKAVDFGGGTQHEYQSTISSMRNISLSVKALHKAQLDKCFDFAALFGRNAICFDTLWPISRNYHLNTTSIP